MNKNVNINIVEFWIRITFKKTRENVGAIIFFSRIKKIDGETIAF